MTDNTINRFERFGLPSAEDKPISVQLLKDLLAETK